jgi:putative endopeptidase
MRSRALMVPVAAAVLGALGACQRASESKVETGAASSAAPAYRLDESQLIQPIRFSSEDIDASKSACVDLGEYANSKWLLANPIPADQRTWGIWEVLTERSLQVQKQLAEQVATKAAPTGIEKLIADIWATGMDEAKRNADGIAPLKSRLDEIAVLKDGASIAAYLRVTAARGENPLFGFFSESDFKNSAMKMAYAAQGGTGLPDRGYYFDADKKATREAYVKHIAKILQLSGVPDADAAKQATQVMAFETRLAKVSKSREELARDLSLYYNPVSLPEADKLTPHFSWTEFFASQKLAAPAKFSLAVPAFHQEVDRMLTAVPVDQWQNYLRFRLVDDAAPYLGDAFATETFDFYSKTLGGQEEMKALWKRVMAQVDTSVGEAMGQLYVKVAFPPESRDRMQKLVDNLLAALKVRLQNLTWMSDATKGKALAKWSAFTSKIGYPAKWREWSGLATSRDSYYANMMAARAFNYRYDLNKIGKPTDRTEWQMIPQEVNAYNNWLQNEIVFPAAILQPPFFDPKADDALNYGAIGTVIGHELIHGYDDQGSRFGPSGNMEDWWAPEDKRKFAALTDKLIAQYNAYDAMPGLKVNGKLTLGENIADLGGINVAHDALQRATKDQPDPKIDGLTREQRFFLGFASAWRAQLRPEAMKVLVASNEHAPDGVRARGTPTNVPAFAAAFGCKPGDAMVNTGAKLLTIW